MTLISEPHTISGDFHIHLEGMEIDDKEFTHLFEKSIELVKENKKMIKQLEVLTHEILNHLINNFYLLTKRQKESQTFSFSEFLTRMYFSKIILSTSYDHAAEFTYQALKRYFKKYPNIRMGITPSVPVDFPHLSHRKWTSAIYNGIAKALNEKKDAKLTLVIETKRQHLDTKINNQFVYKSNLKFLHQIRNKAHPRIDFSLSICDDEAKHPLFKNETRWINFREYLTEATKHENINVSLHMLEALPDTNLISKKHKRNFYDDPSYELTKTLDLLDELDIKNVYFIHMGNLYGGIPAEELQKAKLAKKIGNKNLKRLLRRKDRIVVCYSSNQSLQNPFLLDYIKPFEAFLKNQLNITLGTDDPYPFRVGDIDEELDKTTKHLRQLHKTPQTQIRKQFIRNSYYNENKESKIKN